MIRIFYFSDDLSHRTVSSTLHFLRQKYSESILEHIELHDLTNYYNIRRLCNIVGCCSICKKDILVGTNDIDDKILKRYSMFSSKKGETSMVNDFDVVFRNSKTPKIWCGSVYQDERYTTLFLAMCKIIDDNYSLKECHYLCEHDYNNEVELIIGNHYIHKDTIDGNMYFDVKKGTPPKYIFLTIEKLYAHVCERFNSYKKLTPLTLSKKNNARDFVSVKMQRYYELRCKLLDLYPHLMGEIK